VGHFQPFFRDEKENKVGHFEVAIGGVFSSGHPGFWLEHVLNIWFSATSVLSQLRDGVRLYGS